MKVAELFAEFRVKTSGLRRDLKQASDTVASAGRKMVAVIGGVGRRIGSTFRQLGRAARRFALGLTAAAGAIAAAFFKVNDELADTILKARAIGADPRTLQALQEVFRNVGADAEDASEALAELNLKIGEAIDAPTSDAAEAFRSLGLSVRDLERSSSAGRLLAVFRAFGDLQSTAIAGDLAERIFSTEGRRILGALREGEAALRAGEAAAARGGLLTPDVIDRVLKARAAFGDLRRAFRELSTEISLRIAPVITGIVEAITLAVRDLDRFKAVAKSVADEVFDFIRVSFERLVNALTITLTDALGDAFPFLKLSPERRGILTTENTSLANQQKNLARFIGESVSNALAASRAANAGPGFLGTTPDATLRESSSSFAFRLSPILANLLSGVTESVTQAVRKTQPRAATAAVIQTAFGSIRVNEEVRLLEGIEQNTLGTRVAVEQLNGVLT